MTMADTEKQGEQPISAGHTPDGACACASASPTSSTGHLAKRAGGATHGTQQPRRRWTLSGGILVVLALVLGLGLGLGLRNRHGHNNNSASASSSSSNVATVPLEKLVDPTQLVLHPTFDVHAPAQTREYDWTLEEIVASPAGTSKRMLVVNGISPGPLIEANLGDRIVVNVYNKMPK